MLFRSTNRSSLPTKHILSIQLPFVVSTLLHTSSTSLCLFKNCTASPLLLARCNPDYPRSRGECEWQAATEPTRWRSADHPCSSTTSPAHPLRCGLTHITVIATTTQPTLHRHPSFLAASLAITNHSFSNRFLPAPALLSLSRYKRTTLYISTFYIFSRSDRL